MVCNKNNALGEFKLDSAVRRRSNLSRDSLIAADPDRRRAPEVGHHRRCDSEGSLRHGHISVVPLLVDKIKGRADGLCDKNAA